jgi:hypothetical protein
MNSGPSSKAFPSSKASVGERLIDETKEFAIVAVYLGICFTALAYLKHAILQAEGVPFAPFGFAIAKALICAKFVLIGRMFKLGERSKHLPLIWSTLHRSLAFLLLLLFLNAVEEIVVGIFHHRDVASSVAGLGGGTIQQMVATSVVMLLILIPFFAFRALGEVVGAQNLVRVFLLPRTNVQRR